MKGDTFSNPSFWVSCYTCQISGVYESAKVTKDRLIQPMGNLETFGRLHIWLTKPSFRIRLRSDKVFVHDFSHDATDTSLITSMLFLWRLGDDFNNALFFTSPRDPITFWEWYWNLNTLLRRWLDTPIILWQGDWIPREGKAFQWRPKQVDTSRQVRSDLQNLFGEISPGKRNCCPSNKN